MTRLVPTFFITDAIANFVSQVLGPTVALLYLWLAISVLAIIMLIPILGRQLRVAGVIEAIVFSVRTELLRPNHE